ncbi:MAG: GDSL-type esterase/lipase family protein [Methylibium sp.]|nr:GDSL-type esterase/lipase family protein [Methylibium sp.]
MNPFISSPEFEMGLGCVCSVRYAERPTGIRRAGIGVNGTNKKPCHLRSAVSAIGLVTLLAFMTAPAAGTAAGPTPYPTTGEAWPGEGVVRVFGWMKQNRESFWLQREKKQGALVLAGDSLLGGWRTAESDLGPRTVANRAIGGDVSRGLLFRFEEDVLDLKPSGIVLLIGGNDLSAHQSTDQTVRNIERMLAAITARGMRLPVILCTLPPRDNPAAPIKQSELIGLNAKIRRLAAAYEGVSLLDLYPLFAEPGGQPSSELFSKDRLHLSVAGYDRLQEAIRDAVKALD